MKIEGDKLMNGKVKEFVRNTLGCQCPEEVFEKIEVGSEVKAADYTIEKRINIGDRLLVYIVDGDKLQYDDLKNLITVGKEERDNSDFNRFRLVVLSDDESSLGLEELVKDYEKVHIHLINRNLIRF